jgi:hypothetical protein
MYFRCRLCPEHARCDRCRTLLNIQRSNERADVRARLLARAIIRLACLNHPPDDDPWLLAEDEYSADGRIDYQAVLVATYGARAVSLTVAERELAAAAIIRRGGTVREVCMRLGLPSVIPEDTDLGNPMRGRRNRE